MAFTNPSRRIYVPPSSITWFFRRDEQSMLHVCKQVAQLGIATPALTVFVLHQQPPSLLAAHLLPPALYLHHAIPSQHAHPWLSLLHFCHSKRAGGLPAILGAFLTYFSMLAVERR
jgi:hypothetical protein